MSKKVKTFISERTEDGKVGISSSMTLTEKQNTVISMGKPTVKPKPSCKKNKRRSAGGSFPKYQKSLCIRIYLRLGFNPPVSM